MTATEQTRAVYPCIKCPTSCEVTVRLEAGKIVEVQGNTCKLGDGYVRKEHECPERNVTTTVRLHGAFIPRLPARTSREVPKTAVMAVMRAAAAVDVYAPVVEGQVVCANVAGTGADLVACRSLPSSITAYRPTT